MRTAEPVPSPPGPDRWAAARFGVALAGFCAFLGVYATQPLLPALERLFAVGKGTAALTVSAPTIAVAIGSPFAGLLGARLGHRRVIVAALFALAVPTTLAATAASIHALVAWRFAQGLAVPFVYAVAVAYIAEEWPADGVGRAMSALVAGNVVGGFSGRILAGAAAQRLGWRAAFVALGLLTAAGACAAARALPRVARTARPAAPAGPGLRLDLLALAREPRLLATFAVGFNVLFTLIATFTYVTFHLAGEPFRLGSTALSWIFVVYLAGALVMPFAGRWIDRVGSRRAISTALAGAVLGGLLTLAHALWWVELGLAATCTAVFVSQAASTSFLRSAAPPEARSAASGVYVSCYYLGGAVGGVLPAAVWRAGGWPACVALVAAVQLATLAIAWRFWRPAAPAAEPALAGEVALEA